MFHLRMIKFFAFTKVRFLERFGQFYFYVIKHIKFRNTLIEAFVAIFCAPIK